MHVFYLEESESKRINADERESKRVIVNVCYSGKIESKIIHISVNTSEVKYAKNESVNTREVKDANNKTNYEENLVMDNSAINAPIYFKLFKCGNNFLNKLDATCERV